MNMWDFFDQHWFLAWCALWGVWPAAYVALILIGTVFRMWNRLMRAVNVAVRGWPPAHLDADGDILPTPKPSAPQAVAVKL